MKSEAFSARAAVREAPQHCELCNIVRLEREIVNNSGTSICSDSFERGVRKARSALLSLGSKNVCNRRKLNLRFRGV